MTTNRIQNFWRNEHRLSPEPVCRHVLLDWTAVGYQEKGRLCLQMTGDLKLKSR